MPHRAIVPQPAALRQQLLVGTLLRNLSSFHHHHRICLRDRRKPMGNDLTDPSLLIVNCVCNEALKAVLVSYTKS